MNVQEAGVNEQAVAEYLRDHPGFFEDNLWLLSLLKLPHEAGGAISLVERQITLLRKQNQSQQAQLEELLQIARDNDRLNAQLHQLTLQLLACDRLEDLLALITSRLRQDYAADTVQLHLLAPPRDTRLAGRAEFVSDRDAFRAPFERLLVSGKPFCGRLKAEQLTVLFGDRVEDIGSAVVLPLGDGGRVGLLAIGSADANRFSPGGDPAFLVRMGQVIAAALAGHLQLESD